MLFRVENPEIPGLSNQQSLSQREPNPKGSRCFPDAARQNVAAQPSPVLHPVSPTLPEPMFDTKATSHQDRIARRLVELHGPVRGATILAGAESVLNTVRTLAPSIQRPVMELLFDVFDEAFNEPAPAHAARSATGRIPDPSWRARIN